MTYAYGSWRLSCVYSIVKQPYEYSANHTSQQLAGLTSCGFVCSHDNLIGSCGVEREPQSNTGAFLGSGVDIFAGCRSNILSFLWKKPEGAYNDFKAQQKEAHASKYAPAH